MSITGLVHVNVNCSDFERSLAFYEMLGFRKVIDVPSRNTAEVAAAVGMPPYLVKGALLLLDAERPFMLDLLEWQEPSDDAPPYPHLYHLGLARIALASDDLDGDMAALKARGVEFLSEPATVRIEGQPATRFVCFKDPDGTILELVQ